MNKTKNWILRSSAFFALAVALIAGALAVVSTSASANGVSFVRIIHAATAAEKVDVYLDGQQLIKDFAFASITNNFQYETIPAGTHLVQIAPAGKGADAAVIKKEVTVEANSAYTLAAVGTDEKSFELLVFTDDNRIPANSGQTKARFYNLSPDSQDLDLTVSNVPQGIKDVEYKKATEYMLLPAGKYTITGTTPDGKQLPFELTLNANEVNSAFTVGLTKGEPRLQLVGTRVPAVPGLPDTGSDPNAKPLLQSTLFWSTLSAVAGSIAVGLIAMMWFRRPRQQEQSI